MAEPNGSLSKCWYAAPRTSLIFLLVFFVGCQKKISKIYMLFKKIFQTWTKPKAYIYSFFWKKSISIYYSTPLWKTLLKSLTLKNNQKPQWYDSRIQFRPELASSTGYSFNIRVSEWECYPIISSVFLSSAWNFRTNKLCFNSSKQLKQFLKPIKKSNTKLLKRWNERRTNFRKLINFANRDTLYTNQPRKAGWRIILFNKILCKWESHSTTEYPWVIMKSLVPLWFLPVVALLESSLVDHIWNENINKLRYSLYHSYHNRRRHFHQQPL